MKKYIFCIRLCQCKEEITGDGREGTEREGGVGEGDKVKRMKGEAEKGEEEKRYFTNTGARPMARKM